MSVTGNKGKFSEKLKRILFYRKNRNKFKNNVKLENSNDIYKNYLKVISAIPGLVYENVINDNDDTKKNFNDEKYINDLVKTKDISKNIIDNYSYKKLNNNKDLTDLNTKKILNKQQKLFNGFKGIDDKGNIYNDDKIKKLERSILNLIKKDLIRIVNEMEILQSELYVLSEINGDSVVLKECQKDLDEVKSIICKIDKLKEKYDFLKDNYDFEYLLEIDNHNLVDKIIELRDMVGTSELKAVSTDYKLLDTYKYLYLKLDNLQEKTFKYEEKKKEEELILKERDIDFEKLKADVYNIDYINRNYDNFVRNQNEIIKEIDENINTIDSYELIDYKLKGFNKLFKNSFKYFGLLMVSPLKGVVPAIATETLITGNLIRNLYQNLEWEESKRLVYETIDYSNKIDNAINDLDNTNRIVDMTLDDIVKLKMKYNDKFRKYQGDFVEYREIMHKINDMENKILGNKIKIEMMRKKVLEQQMINQKKLKLVKELNKNQS